MIQWFNSQYNNQFWVSDFDNGTPWYLQFDSFEHRSDIRFQFCEWWKSRSSLFFSLPSRSVTAKESDNQGVGPSFLLIFLRGRASDGAAGDSRNCSGSRLSKSRSVGSDLPVSHKGHFKCHAAALNGSISSVRHTQWNKTGKRNQKGKRQWNQRSSFPGKISEKPGKKIPSGSAIIMARRWNGGAKFVEFGNT